MNMNSQFTSIPNVRPMLNLGCLFDVITGRYHEGMRGEMILNGGMPYITGVGGRGNSFKSTLLWFMMLRVMHRYPQTSGQGYDTEMTASYGRLKELSIDAAPSLYDDIGPGKRFILTDRVNADGTNWYANLKEKAAARRKDNKGALIETPFADDKGNATTIVSPYLVGVDSLSLFATESVLRIQDKEGIGESGRNVEAMRDGGAKTQLLVELPTVTSREGLYFLMSAHMGDNIVIDPYAPQQKKLSFLKNLKFKNVPEKFTFLTNTLWFCQDVKPLINKNTGAAEYPRDSDDDVSGSTDLITVNVMNLRNKSGPTGMPFEVVISQTDGVLPSLTEFNYVKKNNKFGIGGNDRTYFLELMPEVSLSRTTVRAKLAENEKLARAMEITSELCQLTMLNTDLPEGVLCTPKELYEDLKANGHDWDLLLSTRGYWTFDQYTNPIPFLSTLDLLNMRAGLYTPYWYEQKSVQRDAVKP